MTTPSATRLAAERTVARRRTGLAAIPAADGGGRAACADLDDAEVMFPLRESGRADDRPPPARSPRWRCLPAAPYATGPR